MKRLVKVLIVDDEELFRMNLRVLLEDLGYWVAEAANGRDGLEVFDLERPDLVLVDLRMPVLNGPSMIAALREKSPGTPVIVISGTGTLQDAISSLRLGAWDYIIKPVEDTEGLDIIIKRTLEKARLQEQQEQNVRAERMAMLGKVTSSIAHSIRNPLMIIGGFARSLLKDISADDPKKEFLETIVQEARLLEDALSEALGCADAMAPVPDQSDINELVGNVFHEAQCRAVQDGIAFTLDLAPDLPKIRMDSRQMAYCIKKILCYSLDAMSPPGELSVKTRLTEDDILVEIHDTVMRPHREVYDAFYPPELEKRVDTDDLELSFCRVILENNCKSFTVEECDGKGTRYAIRLPLQKEKDGHE
jgi:FixJ family two-component response regulator